MFPWRYVLDRYQLPGIFGLCVLVGFVLNSCFTELNTHLNKINKMRWMLGYPYSFLPTFILLNMFFYGLPINLSKTINYRNWFVVFTQFEREQVLAISQYADKMLAINAVDNLNNWEFLYEIPIHLRYLYNIDYKVNLLEDISKYDYIFTRSSSDPFSKILNSDLSGCLTVNYKKYQVAQINPIKFRDDFVMKPLSTLLDPPLLDNYDYFWKILKCI
jgi:hypothetical protein